MNLPNRSLCRTCAAFRGRAVFAVFLSVIVIAQAPAAKEGSRSWAGTWQTQWRGGGAVLHLQQKGDRVTGTYPLYDGQVEGTVRGRKLEGRWSQASGRSGAFLFTLSPEGGDFMGRFDSGEWWTGTRLSDSHKFEADPVDLTSPRETMRSFLTAANAARAGFVEKIRPALDTIDFSGSQLRSERSADGALLPQERIDYARNLFHVLDALTFRIWSLPGRTDAEATGAMSATVSLGQAGTDYEFPLEFVRRGDSWLIAPPTPEILEAALEDLYARRGGEVPAAPEKLPRPENLDAAEGRIAERPVGGPPGAFEHLSLRHPRATMRTFIQELAHFDSGGRANVERTMDFEEFAASAQGDETRLMAHYLKHIIDRVGYVIYQEIPNDPGQQDPYVHFRHAAGDVVIAPFETEDGGTEWRFTADTLRSLRPLYAAIEGMPEVAGVTEVDHPSAFFAVRDQLRRHAPWLLQRAGFIERWQWLAIALFVFTSMLLAWMLTAVILWIVRRRATWADAFATGRIRLALAWPLRITFAGFFWYLKIGALGLPESIADPFRSVAATLAVGSSVWLAYRGLELAGDFSNRTIGTAGHRAVLTSLTFGILRIVVVVAGALLIADAWSLPYTSVLAGLGVGGLALALAAKQTVENMIAGFTLFADSPLSVGDFCRYGDKLGTVEQIGLRSTRIRSRARTVISIPNSEFANMQLENFAKRDRILLRTTLELRFETTPDQLRFVLAELRRLLIEHPKVDPDSERVRFTGFGAHSLDVEVRAYVLTSDWNEFLGIQEDLYLRMMELVDKSGTGFAFPSQVNYLARDSGNDAGLTQAAEETVAGWRNAGQLPFPEFDPAEVERMENRLDYPPEGSSGLAAGEGRKESGGAEENGADGEEIAGR